ncbi:MAG: phosphate ABC transporter ATP-binding protein [Anaerolineaceae bacterium]|nr:phosphate ABC transporter ATP-binding protein [Anaerolineaceae bacterium]
MSVNVQSPVAPSKQGVDSNALTVRNLDVYYGKTLAVKGVNISFAPNTITALIGPSGCGKSTVLRTLNRMHELVEGAYATGEVMLNGENIYDPQIDPVRIRRRIGMVFQKPNPFPMMSVYENVIAGYKLNRGSARKGQMDELVEKALKGAALWDEVKNKLHMSGAALSGGQQQRLCIARTIAVEPEIILMDEPCSALDPISTQRIEELMRELVKDYTIVIVTHNMQQATRVSDHTAFFNIHKEGMDAQEKRWGVLVEYNTTQALFNQPEEAETADYISGRFG